MGGQNCYCKTCSDKAIIEDEQYVKNINLKEKSKSANVLSDEETIENIYDDDTEEIITARLYNTSTNENGIENSNIDTKIKNYEENLMLNRSKSNIEN